MPALLQTEKRSVMPDFAWGTGRRKTAVARVRVLPGSGEIFLVNGRPLDTYFDRAIHTREARHPLDVLENRGPFDVFVNVSGGGNTGQSHAIRHGLARALQRFDAGLRPLMKSHGFLTRDSRMVERKKYGQPGARKRFQFSKR